MEIGCSIVFPAFNEQETIEQAIHETVLVFESLGTPFEILVVDDGSNDRTDAIVEKISAQDPRVRLVCHEANRGKGAAARTGAKNARGEIMLLLDCDLSTHPKEFAAMLPLLKSNDMVIGSRRVKGASIAVSQSWLRTFSGRLFNLVVRLYFGLPFHDTQCGFKAFNARTRPLFENLQTSGWAFDVELMVKARSRGFKIAEIPVTWRDSDVSRVKISNIWQILKDLRRIKKTV